MFTKSALAAALCVAAFPLAAQVTGGSLGIEYSAPTSGGDLGGTTYSGAIEYSFMRDFAVSLDLSGYRLDNISTDASSATLHGVYHLNEQASVGAFFGADSFDGADSQNLYGLEAGAEFGTAEIEGYVGLLEGDSDDATLFGLDGKYAFANGVSAIGSAGIASSDDVDVTRISIGAEYAITGGPEFFAEIGNVSAEAAGIEADETFIGIGARVAFGAKRGTTFGERSLFEVLPGF